MFMQKVNFKKNICFIPILLINISKYKACEITPVTDINDETTEPQLVEQFFQANKEPPFEYTGAVNKFYFIFSIILI